MPETQSQSTPPQHRIDPATGEPCVHRFKIATPDGRPKIPGKCQKCGQVKFYKASADDSIGDWKNQRSVAGGFELTARAGEYIPDPGDLAAPLSINLLSVESIIVTRYG